MKRILLLILLAAPFVAAGVTLWRKLLTPLPVRVARVERGPALSTVFATGWVEAQERRMLRPPRPAIVEKIFAKEGAEVRAGEPLLLLRDRARPQRKEKAQADLDRVTHDLAEGSALRTSLEAKVNEARVNEEWASSEVERNRTLHDQGLLEQRAFDQLVAQRDAATNRLAQAREELRRKLDELETSRKAAQAELGTLAAEDEDDLQRAPFDGVVLQRFAEEGESVNPERDLMKFGDVRHLIVEGEVDEEDVARVKVGQRVLARLAGDDKTLVRGELSELFPDSNKATRSFRVRVAFPDAKFVADGALGLRGRTRVAGGGELISGRSAELGIVVQEKPDALVFPRSALTARNSVFVVSDGRARERPVELGIWNYDRCEALRGLTEGESVAVDGLGELRDGRRVAPQ